MGAAVLAAPFHSVWAQTAAIAPSGPALTRLEERLTQMDQSLRTLTGKVEELQFNQQQQKQQQDNQLADMTRRMQDMEVRVNSSGTSAPSASTAGVPLPTPPAVLLPPEPVPPSVPSIPLPGTTTTTTTSVTTEMPDVPPVVKTTTVPATNESPVPLTAEGTPPDSTKPIAAAPTVKSLGSMKTDGTAQPGTPEAAYESAFTLLKGEKYAEAETAFRAFVKANPRHDLAGNAQYWLGESLYARKDYKNAAKAFAEGYQKYRKAPKAADNLLKLGLSLSALGNKKDSCITFAQFQKEYQDASASLKARADSESKKLGCDT